MRRALHGLLQGVCLALGLAGTALRADPPVPVTQTELGSGSGDHAGMHHDDNLAPKVPEILPGYGTGGFPITTRVPKAQAALVYRVKDPETLKLLKELGS